MDRLVTWRKLIEDAMRVHGESLADQISIAPIDLDLEHEFDGGYGGSEGRPFTLWTTGRVYFPAVYDGAEWVASVPRNPCEEATSHVGGQ